MIDGIFVPQEAKIIEKIPLARVDYEDVINWPLNPNGVYTCKSGYRFLKEEEEIYPQVKACDKALWKGVWGL